MFDDPTDQQSPNLSRRGLLTKDTTIEIPDQYVEKFPGSSKVNFELTINNWLRAANNPANTAAHRPVGGFYRFDGDKHAYFLPVKIKEAGAGSTFKDKSITKENLPSEEVYIALKHLARSGSLEAIELRDDAEIVAPKPIETLAANPPPDKLPPADATHPKRSNEAVVAAPPEPSQSAPAAVRSDRDQQAEAQTCGYCQTSRKPFEKLQQELAAALKTTGTITHKKARRVAKDEAVLSATFRRTCGRLDYNEYKSFIGESLRQDPLMSSLGLSEDQYIKLMLNESSGRCGIVNPESDTTQSIGLFQINVGAYDKDGKWVPGSTRKPRCSGEQLKRIKRMSMAELQNRTLGAPSTIDCIENPVVNFNESVRIMKQKYQTLFKSESNSQGLFDPNRMTQEDQQRVVLSAYNGGEKWVMRAHRDLLAFNRSQGTDLNPNSWEDLRVFYLRYHLGAPKEQTYFNTTDGDDRRIKMARQNLAYAEFMVPRRRELASN